MKGEDKLDTKSSGPAKTATTTKDVSLPSVPSATSLRLPGGAVGPGLGDVVGVLTGGKKKREPVPKDEDFKSTGPVEIELEVSRQRAASMTAFGLVVGTLLIWKLGTVGVWAGVVLLVIGAFRAWELAQTFLYAPGTIRVTDAQVTLPRGLCLPRPVQVTPGDVTAVYFLRRSVPWNKSAPVLVVEIGDQAMAFPRDWFASEADQRHVVHALMRTTPTGDAQPSKPSSESVTIGEGKAALGQMLGGVVLLGIGIVGTVIGRSQAGSSGHYAIYVGPMVAGAILIWRGFARW